jgi:6-pyruvoyltetrahydropterin/6-carboxytetrahydropterin synthase
VKLCYNIDYIKFREGFIIRRTQHPTALSDKPCSDFCNTPSRKHTIQVSGHFDAAHFLSGYSGKCKNIHGHRFTVKTTLSGNIIPDGVSRGMVVDFGDIKSSLNTICDRFDHTLIYETGTLTDALFTALVDGGFALSEVHFRPTAENFAKFIYEELEDELQKSDLYRNCTVESVTVFETPDNSASYGFSKGDGA